MPSTSAPFGFRPSFHNSGQMRPKEYTIASTYATNIFSGDPVKLTNDGVIQLGTSDGTRTGTVAGITLLGTLAGVEYRDATGKPSISPYWIGGSTGTEIVAYTTILKHCLRLNIQIQVLLALIQCKQPWVSNVTLLALQHQVVLHVQVFQVLS
jgi:hypothetical protein